MAISSKTRKMLWGRSGNRCAFCKNELVVDNTTSDVESVVAEECHIVSSQANGPRYRPSFPRAKIDSYGNLILLCRVHHKLIDDQINTFTVDFLQKMKLDHESWVTNKLTNKRQKSVRVRRKNNDQIVLSRLTAGKQVLDIISYTMAYAFNHDELHSKEEVEMVSNFFQTAQEWGDLSDVLEPGNRVQIAYNLSKSIKELEEAGLFVFGLREVQILEGGAQEEPSEWPVAILQIARRKKKM